VVAFPAALWCLPETPVLALSLEQAYSGLHTIFTAHQCCVEKTKDLVDWAESTNQI